MPSCLKRNFPRVRGKFRFNPPSLGQSQGGFIVPIGKYAGIETSFELDCSRSSRQRSNDLDRISLLSINPPCPSLGQSGLRHRPIHDYNIRETPSKSNALCCKEVAVVSLSKLTETPPNLGRLHSIFSNRRQIRQQRPKTLNGKTFRSAFR